MNQRIRLFVVSIFVLLLSSFAFPQLAVESSRITEFDFNGMKVVIKRRPGTPTVSTGLFVRGGTRYSGTQNPGIENFALNAAAEGSVKFPRAAIQRELARTASVIDARAFADYSMISLTSTRQNFARSWEIFSDIALAPAYLPADVELTRGKILTALRSRSEDPDSQLQSLVDKIILGKTTYGEDPLGTTGSISGISSDDLRSYHKKMMETSRLLLVVVGDLDAEELKRLVSASFGKLPRGNYAEPTVPSLDFSRPTLDITQRTLETNYVNGVFAAPSLKDTDYYAMCVAVSLLQSRVFEEVRTKRNLSYAPNAQMGSLAANTGSIYVTAVDADQAVTVMLNEIEKLKSTLVDSDQIAGVAGYFLTLYYMKQETNAAQVAELAQYEMIGGGWRNSLEFLDRIRKVTPAEVQTVAKKYMRNLRFVVVGNPAQINRSIYLPN